MTIITEEKRNKTAEGLIYLALTIEIILMIVEKSEISFSLESYVFRGTFLLTLLAVALMKHDKREWAVIFAVTVFCFVCYRLSGKNDLLRVAFFVMAARDIDLKKAMKYCFYVSLCGFILIALLSCAGILGDMARIEDYGRGIADEKRYVLGFGHPNTLFGSVYALILMWIWIYGKKAGVLSYIAMAAASVVISVITRSRTGLVIMAATVILTVIVRLFPKLSELKFLYWLEALFSPIFCAVFAIVAAGWSEVAYTHTGIFSMPKYYGEIDYLLNNRISNIYYGASDRGAILGKWKLFAGHGADSYFDMGWVRLFYWYGILPTVVIILALLAVIIVCCKKRDLWTLVVIFSISFYTIVEATFVTRYIGRDFFLLIAGVYLGVFFREFIFKRDGNERKTDVANA